MSEAADAFDAEFETARAAGEGDDAHDNEAGPGAGAGEREDAEDQVDHVDEDGDDDPDARQKAESERVAKRLSETQRALKAERRKRQDEQRKFEERISALEKGKGGGAPLSPTDLLAKLREDDDDPIGDIQVVKQLAKLLVGQTDDERQADAQTTQRQQALSAVSTAMKEYEDDFADLHPDYSKAAAHFMAARAEELKDTGLSDESLRTAMGNEFAGIVTRSINSGKDPAEIIYNMALRRGFKPGGASAKLSQIERGQTQSRTLFGGGSPSGGLTAGKVADLHGAAFDAAFDKLKASSKRRG